jgi:hypothetical protein
MPKPPHLLKVGVGCNNSLGAKSHSAAGNFQSLKAHKIALLPERRSGTLVSKHQTPKRVAAVASSCHRSYLSFNSCCLFATSPLPSVCLFCFVSLCLCVCYYFSSRCWSTVGSLTASAEAAVAAPRETASAVSLLLGLARGSA